MQNYFNYFTEIEERFQQRRGSSLMLSTLDWALIEIWREAGVPLSAVLRGIDDAFDEYDAKTLRAKARVRRVNGLAWCAQSVMEAVEAMHEAEVRPREEPQVEEKPVASGFEWDRIGRFLESNAARLEVAQLPRPADEVNGEVVARLREMAEQASGGEETLEQIDRRLTVFEERLFGALMTGCSEETLVSLREQAARELAPYRGKMQSVQIKQVQQQILQKRLFERYGVPRLSLFYMSHG